MERWTTCKGEVDNVSRDMETKNQNEMLEIKNSVTGITNNFWWIHVKQWEGHSYRQNQWILRNVNWYFFILKYIEVTMVGKVT